MSFKQALQSPPMRYALALVVTALALGLRWLIDPWVGAQVPFTTFFAATALSAFFLGPGPAIASAALGGALAQSLFLGRPATVATSIPLTQVAYAFSCMLIIVVGALARRRGEQAESAARDLRASESQMQQMVDGLPMLISYIDRDLRYRFNNRTYEQWFGTVRDALRGRHMREVLGDEAFSSVRPAAEKALAGIASRFEAELDYAVAGRRQVSIAYVPHKVDGEVSGFFVMVEDVGDRKRAEHARAHLAAIFESAEDAVVSKTLDSRVVSWNAGAERLFGFSAAEMIGQSIERIIPLDLKQDEVLILERLRRGERIEHFETERLRRDGRRIPVSLTVSPIRDASGRVTGASKIARDISERRRHEQQLAEADRRKDEFLATLAHELRNPLAPILNAAQFMRLRGTLDPALQGARDIIERQARHMTRLVDDLLDMSRINRGRVVLQKDAVLLEHVLRSAVDAARPQAEAAGQDLQLDLPERSLPLHGDATRLSQVFGNLLSNAVKFTPRGGRIVVSAGHEHGDAVVRVHDNGIGIAAPHLERIFEMFTQADSSLERGQSGLGIGLTLARQLVGLHRGTVVAQSPGLGQGSEFVVRLPLDAAADEIGSRPEPPLGAPLVDAPRHRIVVADDNLDVSSSLVMNLRLAGHDVHVARDGAEAVEAVTRIKPQVALLDIGMPNVNGYEAARRIRALPGGGSVHLIALTGWGQEEDRRRALEAGFDQHCTKPVDIEELQRLLARAPAR